MNEGLAALHAQSQSTSPSRKPNRAREKDPVASDSQQRAAVVAASVAVCRVPSYPRPTSLSFRRHHLLHHGSFHDPR